MTRHHRFTKVTMISTQSVKRKSHAKLLDKLNILRKKFQLIKKDEPSLEEQQISSPCLAKPVKKIIRKKRKKIIKNKDKKNKTKSKKDSRKVHTQNLKIKKKQGIRRRLGSVGPPVTGRRRASQRTPRPPPRAPSARV